MGHRESKSRIRAFDFGMLKRPEFLLIQVCSCCANIGYVVLLFTLPTYAEAIGLNPNEGNIIGAVFNLGQMLGRLLIALPLTVGDAKIWLLWPLFTAEALV